MNTIPTEQQIRIINDNLWEYFNSKRIEPKITGLWRTKRREIDEIFNARRDALIEKHFNTRLKCFLHDKGWKNFPKFEKENSDLQQEWKDALNRGREEFNCGYGDTYIGQDMSSSVVNISESIKLLILDGWELPLSTFVSEMRDRIDSEYSKLIEEPECKLLLETL
jgi:hypothetical protein